MSGAAAVLTAVALLIVANGAPVAGAWLLGGRGAWSIDGGLVLADGRPLLGPSKTWRGLALAVLSTAATAAVLGLPPLTGAAVGAAAMVGDIVSSFVKRRRGVPSSGRAPVLDQVPEAMLPLLVCRELLGLSWGGIAVATALFALLDVILSPLLFRLGLRARPY